MEEFTASTASSWLAIATGPYGGAFVIGVIMGALFGIYLWNRFHVGPRMEQEKHLCQARIDALQKELGLQKRELEQVKIVATKWEQFMERKALEALGD